MRFETPSIEWSDIFTNAGFSYGKTPLKRLHAAFSCQRSLLRPRILGHEASGAYAGSHREAFWTSVKYLGWVVAQW